MSTIALRKNYYKVVSSISRDRLGIRSGVSPRIYAWEEAATGNKHLTSEVKCCMSILTVKCKMSPTEAERASLDRTLEAFAAGVNFALDCGRKNKTASKVKIQYLCYGELRAATGLSANLAIRAINRAAGILKVKDRQDSTATASSIDYDQRIFSFREADWTVSLTTVDGRAKGIALNIGEYQRELLRGQNPTSATVWKTRQGDYFIGIQVKRNDPVPLEAKEWIGVDLGIVNVATTSDGDTFSGAVVDRVRNRYADTRASLQRKGTKGAKRVLKRLSGRERRFQQDVNHQISKRIVATANDTGRGIRVEDLTGIRQRTRVRKEQRARHHRWAFHQLRTFLFYKAVLAGVPFELVDPRYTSRTCPVCGHQEKANRKSQSEFECKACGHEANADLVGALNISFGGAVNRLEVAVL